MKKIAAAVVGEEAPSSILPRFAGEDAAASPLRPPLPRSGGGLGRGLLKLCLRRRNAASWRFWFCSFPAPRRARSSSMVIEESYFLRLAQSEEPPRATLTGVVAELAGVLKGSESGDPKVENAEYLRKKYS